MTCVTNIERVEGGVRYSPEHQFMVTRLNKASTALDRARITSMRAFTITTHHSGRRREVQLRVYPTLAHMRRAANRWARQALVLDAFNDAAGICHGLNRHRLVDGEWIEYDLVAIIRLAETHITPEIVAHEVVHAAQHLYALDMIEDENSLAHEHFHSGNEEFAYLTGDLFAAAWYCVRGAESEPSDGFKK